MAILRRLSVVRSATSVPAQDDRSRHLRLGLGLYVLLAVVLLLLAVKPQLKATLNRDTEITAEFNTQYKLREHDSSVKMAGITVGMVTGIEDTDRGTVRVTMKVDDEVIDKLGARPSAEIEPRTLLGGRYAVELHPGRDDGRFSGAIPADRTNAPVELDTILEALPADARTALQGLVGKAGPSLDNSQDELSGLLETAPDVLDPGADVMDAAQGTRPERDLTEIVDNLDRTAATLGRSDRQLDGIAADLSTTSEALADHREELAIVLDELPQTLRSSTSGINGLAGTVAELETTAKALRPSAPHVDELLTELDPALRAAAPVLKELVPTLRQLRPAVRELVPVATRATGVLRDLRGPVMGRVKGPVMDFLLNPWVGSGAYADSAKGYQADHKVYEELAYMVTNIDRASMGQDLRGSTLAFQAGVGLSTLHGLPFSLESLVQLALDNANITDPAVRRAAQRKAGAIR
jgi:phospholipid/cholesterol/gamma-HCH transport system substrate-binding protein